MYKLIVTDLDNTLLDERGEVPEATLKVCRTLAEKKVEIAVATGRSYASAKAIAERIHSQMPMICYNGAEIVDQEGTSLYASNVSRDVQEEVVDFVLDRGLYLQVYDQGEIVVEKLDLKAHPDPDLKYASYRETHSLWALGKIKTPKLLIAGPPEKIPGLQRELEKKLGYRVYIAQSEAHLIEIMDKEANKGRALKILADKMGFVREDVMALGDNTNDILLLQAAGLGVAVGNGVKDLKVIADYICEHDRSYGFNEAVEKFIGL